MTTAAASTSVILSGSHYTIDSELIEQKQSPAPTPLSRPNKSPNTPTSAKTLVIDKTLASAANLAKLLPTCTVLCFQALSPSFSNKGHCYTSNQILTYGLLFICVVCCFFFTFTDSLVGRDGRVYYGVATSEGLYVFNLCEGGEEEKGKVFDEGELRRRRRRWVDWVHAVFGVLVFLALALSDGDVQKCLFAGAGAEAKELLVNLPLGVGVFASLVFMVFPTTRKGIGYADYESHFK